jgi:hypothetical protein
METYPFLLRFLMCAAALSVLVMPALLYFDHKLGE